MDTILFRSLSTPTRKLASTEWKTLVYTFSFWSIPTFTVSLAETLSSAEGIYTIATTVSSGLATTIGLDKEITWILCAMDVFTIWLG